MPLMRDQQITKTTVIDLKKDINSNTIVVGEFITTLTPFQGSTRLKLIKEIIVLKEKFEEKSLVDVHRDVHKIEDDDSQKAKYLFFSNTHDSFSMIDHMIKTQNLPL